LASRKPFRRGWAEADRIVRGAVGWPGTVFLPDPPDTLPANPRLFLETLQTMLEVVKPRALDVDRVRVTFDEDGVDVDLPHASEDEWVICAMVGPDNAIVGTGVAHEHFGGDGGGRPWPVVAVDFIAELLRGQIEVERVVRAGKEITARRYLIDEQGERVPLGSTHLLRPARFMFWTRTQVERARIDFDAAG